MNRNLTLQVTLFGEFKLTSYLDGKVRSVSDRTSTSKKLWPFLQYLIVFRQRELIPQSEIIHTLWDREDERDPVNALKTLLHRARNTMEQLGCPDGKQIILYRRGFYSWNHDLPLELDCEVFSALYQEAEQQGEHRLPTLLRAIELYQGDLLPKYPGTPWVAALRAECREKYLAMCLDAATLLGNAGRYPELVTLCRRALELAPYEEALHLCLVKALNDMGDQQAAIQHYAHASRLFLDQLGTNLSDGFTSVYRELIQKTQRAQLDLSVVRKSMMENAPSSGPFYCELAIFEEIYRREARVAQRSGNLVQLAMISILEGQTKRATPRQMSVDMERLKNSLFAILRKGDAFTRFSASQYLLLLPCATRQGGGVVVRRIVSHYRRRFPKASTLLHSSVLPLLPLPEPEPPILDEILSS